MILLKYVYNILSTA